MTLLAALLTGTATPAREQATQTFDLTSASIADINAAFDSDALTSETLTKWPAISTLGGQMRNPHALDRSPQGSSGGNAAALAARFAVAAIGTDTGGCAVRPPSPPFRVYGRHSDSSVAPVASHGTSEGRQGRLQQITQRL